VLLRYDKSRRPLPHEFERSRSPTVIGGAALFAARQRAYAYGSHLSDIRLLEEVEHLAGAAPGLILEEEMANAL
jgi:hypothetical protein